MAGKQLNFDVLAVAKATGFDEAARKVDRLSTAGDKSSKSFERQTKSAGLMSTALLSVGSAAVPLAGVAAGALIGLGAAGAVALVGILGIATAMKQGTALGKQYQAAFKPLVAEFGLLKQIGAQGLFSGINSGVKSLKPLFPVLNRDVALFSSQLGKIAGNVAPGLVALFTRLNPLFATIGDQLVHGSQGFESWAKSSQAVGKFVAYVQTTLPQVEQTVGALITTISHIAIAAEPFGGTTLTAIRLFSSAINAIPIGVLQTLVPLLLGLKVGASLSAGFNNAAAKIEGFGKKAGGASGAVSGLGKAVGFLGPVGIAAGLALGGLSVIMGRSKQNAIEDAKRVNDLTQAIQNQTTATVILAQLQGSGAVKAGKDLGLTQQTLVKAILEHGAALDSTKAKIAAASVQYKAQNAELQRLSGSQAAVNDPKTYNAAVTARNKLYGSLTTLSKGLQQEQADYQKAKTDVAAWAKEQGSSVLAAEISNGSYAKIAKSLGLTGDAYINAKVAADQNTKSIQTQTAAMILENNAAGLLDGALQKLGGNNLGVAQATTGAITATVAAGKALHDNGVTLDQNTEKGRANATALQGQASAAIQLAKSIEQNTGSTVKGNAALANQKARLEATLRAQHELTPAVQAYIDTLYKIPARKETVIDVNAAAAAAKVHGLQTQINSIRQNKVPGVTAGTADAAGKIRALQEQIDALHGKYIPITVAQQNVGLQSQRVSGARAAGGPVRKGESYIVGEYRREIFTPDANGYISPRVPSSSGGAGHQRVHVTVGFAKDASGNFQAFVQDVVDDQSEFAGMTSRMGAS